MDSAPELPPNPQKSIQALVWATWEDVACMPWPGYCSLCGVYPKPQTPLLSLSHDLPAQGQPCPGGCLRMVGSIPNDLAGPDEWRDSGGAHTWGSLCPSQLSMENYTPCQTPALLLATATGLHSLAEPGVPPSSPGGVKGQGIGTSPAVPTHRPVHFARHLGSVSGRTIHVGWWPGSRRALWRPEGPRLRSLLMKLLMLFLAGHAHFRFVPGNSVAVPPAVRDKGFCWRKGSSSVYAGPVMPPCAGHGHRASAPQQRSWRHGISQLSVCSKPDSQAQVFIHPVVLM